MPIQTGSFNNIIAPGLRKVALEEHNQYPSLIPTLLNVENSTRNFEETQTVAGLGVFAEKPEGDTIAYEDLEQAYYKRTAHTVYAKGVRYTREMRDDDLYGVFNGGRNVTPSAMRRSRGGKVVRSLVRAANETRETSAAEIWNTGTGTTVFTVGNGGALFRNDHPLAKSGSTGSNLGTGADLAETSLKALITILDNTVDEAGKRLNIRARHLLTESSGRYTAKELVRSSHDPENDTQHINALVDENLTAISWNYITDSDAWGLVANKDQHDICWFDRWSPEVSFDGDFDTEDVLVKMVMRYSIHINDWRGVAWNVGA